MSFSVTILGSSSAKPTVARHPSVQAVNVHEQYYLVDAGEGVQQQLVRYGVNPLKIRAVFISHLHGDHVFGLFPLISTLALYGRKTPLRVFAPAPFGEILACHLRYFDTELPYTVAWTEVDTTKHALLLESLRVLKKGGVFVLHDNMKPQMYGDMNAFAEKLRGMGFAEVRYVETAEAIFGSKSRAAMMMLGDSAMLVGRK